MGLDDLDETQARLEKLNNSELIAECVAFMPDCLEEI
jgi:protoheme ferro-lyase